MLTIEEYGICVRSMFSLYSLSHNWVSSDRGAAASSSVLKAETGANDLGLGSGFGLRNPSGVSGRLAVPNLPLAVCVVCRVPSLSPLSNKRRGFTGGETESKLLLL